MSRLDSDEVWSHTRPRAGRNLGYLDDELRLQTNRAGWHAALLARQRAVAVVSHDALDLARTLETSQHPSTNRQWALALRYQGFAGAGIELGQRIALAPQWRFQWALQGLQLLRMAEREAQGQAAYAASSQIYSADLVSTQTDNRLKFPYQQGHPNRGNAWLSHGALSWQGEQTQASISWRDAGVLRWRGLPQQTLRLSSDIQQTDADGYLIYAPLIQGQNSQINTRRWMAPWTTFQVGWRSSPTDSWRLSSTWLPHWGALPTMGWTRSWAQQTKTTLSWQFHEQRATLCVSVPWAGSRWVMGVGTDFKGATQSRSFSFAWQSSTSFPSD